MISDSNFISDDGISIPCKYTSYLAPLTSSKLWNETRACKDPGKIPEVNKKFKKYLSYNLKCMFRCNLFSDVTIICRLTLKPPMWSTYTTVMF